jgi:hypothetical protein
LAARKLTAGGRISLYHVDQVIRTRRRSGLGITASVISQDDASRSFVTRIEVDLRNALQRDFVGFLGISREEIPPDVHPGGFVAGVFEWDSGAHVSILNLGVLDGVHETVGPRYQPPGFAGSGARS